MFLVCGEALFDFFLETEDGPASARYAARAGGSPFNVAIGLARLGRREKKSAPPPTNGSTWRMCFTPLGSNGRSWESNRPLPPAHFTKGAASRGCCSILAATAADVVMCSMITYTSEKAEESGEALANSDLFSAS